MRTVQDIFFDVDGQSLIFDCPEGRPSSITSVEVFPWDVGDDGIAELATTGSAAVETDPNTTTDAACGPSQADKTLIPLTATTGIEAGRLYLLTDGDAFKEWVDVIAIDSGVSVTARHPLHNDYTTGATFQTTRISVSVDATWVADLTKLRDDAGPNAAYRVRWVYVVSGVTYVADAYFNLVRYAGQHGVRPQDIDSVYPGWLDSLPTDHQRDQGRRLLDEAYRGVKIDLHAAGMDDASVANSEIVDELTRLKALEVGELARLVMGGSDPTRYHTMREVYQTRLDGLAKIAPKIPVRDTAGAAQPAVSIGLTRR